MIEKNSEQVEQERLAEKNGISERDKTLWEYLERSERHSDESMLSELVSAGEGAKGFGSSSDFVN